MVPFPIRCRCNIMFVKVYQYQIQPDRIDEYLEIQKKSAEIYASYIDFHSFCINSNQEKK